MDFVKVVAPVRDIEIEDLGMTVLKGKSHTIHGEDLTRTEDLWRLLKQGDLLQILSRFSRPLKSDSPPPVEEVEPEPTPLPTAEVEKRLDEVLEGMKAPPVPNALRKLVDDGTKVANAPKQKKGKRHTS